MVNKGLEIVHPSTLKLTKKYKNKHAKVLKNCFCKPPE